MAAGLSLPVEQVPAFTACFLHALRESHPLGLPEPTLELCCWIELEDLSVEFLQQMERLQPYGQANPEPLFGLRGVVLDQAPDLFGEGNFRFHLPKGSKSSGHWSGIAWRMESAPPVAQPIDCAIRFGWNYWRGQKMAQVTLVDWRRSL
jgi:single-stranded-DNA-specific exonuclease